MRDLSPAFAASISGGATTLARCWKLTRRDGVAMGFTDHDRDLTFDGVTFAALTGVEGSEIEQHFGFAVGGAEIAGALAASGLAEADLAKGLWDDAAIEIFVVDWTDPGSRLLIGSGSLGEARRHGAAFVAELRGLAHRLDEERGRLYAAACPAALGDSRCGVDLDDPRWRAGATVIASDGAALLAVAGLGAFDEGLFAGGSLRWTSGANAGLGQDVRDHRASGADISLALWSAPPAGIAAGDGFDIVAGCDKRFATCRDRFANALNFRGFPHLPGNELLLRVARAGEPEMDGGSFFR